MLQVQQSCVKAKCCTCVLLSVPITVLVLWPWGCLPPSLVPQSAKSNLNVDNVFFTIARDIKQRLAETAEERPEVGWGWEWVRAGVLAGW